MHVYRNIPYFLVTLVIFVSSITLPTAAANLNAASSSGNSESSPDSRKSLPHSYWFSTPIPPSVPRMCLKFTHAEIVTPEGLRADAALTVIGNRIERIDETDATVDDGCVLVNCSGLRIYPALINAHDHVLDNWFPSFQGPKFADYMEWYDYVARTQSNPADRKETAASNLEQTLVLQERIELTVYKQILNGVGTVEIFSDNRSKFYAYGFPIRLLDHFSHTLCLYRKNWAVKRDFERTKNLFPYIIHLGEGITNRSRNELNILDHWGALSSNTVIVHGLAFNSSDWDRIARAGASLIWCPSSNLNLYGATTNVQKALERNISVCIGTDGARTGAMGLLQELRTAQASIPCLSPRILFEMVTSIPAKVFGIESKVGRILPGHLADLLILPQKTSDPFQDLLASNPEDIALLMVDGRPVYADPVLFKRLPDLSVPMEEMCVGGQAKVVVAGLKPLLNRIELRLGRPQSFHFLPICSIEDATRHLPIPHSESRTRRPDSLRSTEASESP